MTRYFSNYILSVVRKEVMFVLRSIGTGELVVLALLILFFVGGKKLPELARGVGDSIREFRKATKEEA